MAKSKDENMQKMMEMLANPDIAQQFKDFINNLQMTPKKKGRPKKVKPSIDDDAVDMTEEKEPEPEHSDVTIIDLTKNSSKKNKNKMCRRVSLGKPTNVFNDDGVEAFGDYEQFDKLVKRGPRKKSSRKPMKLKIRCRECKEIKIVDADVAAVRWDAEDASSYICDDCVPGRS